MSALTDRSRLLADIDSFAGRLALLTDEVGTRPTSDLGRAERLHGLVGALLLEAEVGQPADPLLLRATCAEAVLWLERLGNGESDG